MCFPCASDVRQSRVCVPCFSWKSALLLSLNLLSFPFSESVLLLWAALPPVKKAFPAARFLPTDFWIFPAYLRPVSDCLIPRHRNQKTLCCPLLPQLLLRQPNYTDSVSGRVSALVPDRMAYSRALLCNSTALSLLPIRSTELFALSAPEILFSLFVPVTVRPPGSINLSAYSYFYYTIFYFTMQLVCLLIVLNF